MNDRSGPTERTRVRREPNRGRYDLATVREIVDAALIAHVGFVDEGQPFVIPMAVARDGDRLLLHGSTASRLMRTAASGSDVCVTVTHLDGVVALDRSSTAR
jgi:nitroimidazol reductase NimA-like FMN-containing flavoprotein (pyridoxamine 5'-phosphate oxidase superfamily)